MKKLFNLSQYTENNVAMHCKNVDEAEQFTHYLHARGRRWINGTLYIGKSLFHIHKQDTCYCFNRGTYSYVRSVLSRNYRILEFDDFDWEFDDYDWNENDIPEDEKAALDCFLNNFRLN